MARHDAENLERQIAEVDAVLKILKDAKYEKTHGFLSLTQRRTELQQHLAAQRVDSTRRPSSEDLDRQWILDVYRGAPQHVREALLARPETASWLQNAGSVGMKAILAGAVGLAVKGYHSAASMPQNRQAVGVVCFSTDADMEELWIECNSHQDWWRDRGLADNEMLSKLSVATRYRVVGNVNHENAPKVRLETASGKAATVQAVVASTGLRPKELIVERRMSDGKQQILQADPHSHGALFVWLPH